MAITGTGIELDPFIVHSYAEIVEAFGGRNSQEMYYSKLANDINCNDYGSGWEWETITAGSNASGANCKNTLDLDGHTIKNVYIKNSNMLFKANSTQYATIKNGKILNVFGNSPANIIQKVACEELSISSQIGTPSGTPFDSGTLQRCAVYLIVTNAAGRAMFFSATAESFKNLDAYVEAYNCNNFTKIFSGSSTGSSNIDSVRCVGKLKLATGATPTTPQNGVLCSGKATNSVFDVDMSDFDYTGQTVSTRALFSSTGDNTTVVNSEKVSVPVSTGGFVVQTGYLQATTAQMTVGSELRGLGFLVVNVEGT